MRSCQFQWRSGIDLLFFCIECRSQIYCGRTFTLIEGTLGWIEPIFLQGSYQHKKFHPHKDWICLLSHQKQSQQQLFSLNGSSQIFNSLFSSFVFYFNLNWLPKSPLETLVLLFYLSLSNSSDLTLSCLLSAN